MHGFASECTFILYFASCLLCASVRTYVLHEISVVLGIFHAKHNLTACKSNFITHRGSLWLLADTRSNEKTFFKIQQHKVT